MSITINGVNRPSRSAEYETYNFGMQHMAGQKHLVEEQRSTDFEFVVTQLDGLPRITDGADRGNYENAQEILRFSVATASVPHFEISPLETRRGNSVQKFAGTPSFSDGEITVYDFIGSDTAGILMAWQHQAYNVYTDKVGLMEDYKRDAVLIEYTPDRQIVRKWNLYGCWVNNISEDTFDHESDQSTRKLTATIQYDLARLDIED
jgi:hypothetical protein